ncbi:ClpP-like prohead protease/major capsid protein fusion protein [Spectribacter hydrogenoxidans]|uniref:ATP-dependent Clp protease proteolytic subunit n=1 Tax=Spectribacter hydrogenoxidans TaxID=3075608 RepID=A0ABU3C0L5_9GAMM|nr:ClpP-like prohead protease/major capsid protein fusion protein [Salinisphaera sp. W335]MDT0635095.1 Clp protease ClpP [Salinisphaera sp. W335]
MTKKATTDASAPNPFEVRAALEDGTAEILIYGDIGESIFGKTVAARELVQQLQDIEADEILVRINSYGGSVADGTAIYNALRRHPADITVSIDGVAVSIASLIAMAGDTIDMAENALFMMHAPWGLSVGNAKKMRKTADLLDKFADAMVSAYTRVVGNDREDEIRDLLYDGEDHWYTAEEAEEMSFVTRVTDALPLAAHAGLDLQALYDRFQVPAAAAALTPKEAPMTTSTKGRTANRPNKTDPNAAGNTPPADQPKATGTDPAPTPAQPSAGGQPSDPDAIRAEARQQALADERERREEISAIFQPFAHVEGVAELERTCMADTELPVSEAQNKLLRKIGEGSEPLGGAQHGNAGSLLMGESSEAKQIRGMSEALLARTGAKNDDGTPFAHDGSNPWRGLRLHEVARACLERAGVNVRGQNPEEFVGKALSTRPLGAGQTRSDFPIILENTMHKLVLLGFQSITPSYPAFTKIGDVSDFREWRRLVPGLMGNLGTVNEAGEYQNKNLPDADRESIAVERRGNIINISIETIVNDDLGYIQDMAMGMGMTGQRTIDRTVYALLAMNGGDGPKLADGNNLFTTGRGNKASSGGAPSVETLVAGADAMAAQTAPGEDAEPLDIQPRVSVAGTGVARDIGVVVNSNFDPDASNKLQRANKARNLVEDVVGSPRITGTRWYMFADPLIAPVIEVVFLNGQREPRITEEENFRTSGMAWKVELPHQAGAIDYRGGYTNAGG